jgi:hypothetical protein
VTAAMDLAEFPGDEPTDDLGDALQELANAQPGYTKAEQYADGPVEEVFVSERLRNVMRMSGVNFQEILGEVVINAVANRLSITAVLSSDQDTADAITTLDRQAKMTLLRPEVNRLTLKFGDHYLFAWKRSDDTIQVVNLDARCARLFYDPDDPMTPSFGVRKWVTRDKFVRVDLLYSDRCESYISAKADTNAKAAGDFVPYTVPGNDDHVVPHDFGRPPLFHFSTTLPGEYGKPEHEPFYATQDILLKLTLGHMAAVDYTAIPQRWAIMEAGVSTTEAEDQDDAAYWGTHDSMNPALRTHERERKSSLQSRPGSLWLQRGIKQFGQFDPADPAGFLDPALHHLKIGATATSTPLHYFDGVSGSLPSGESLKVALEPLIAKATARKDVLDDAWVTFYATVLGVLGHAKAQVDLRWAPIEPTSETDTWTVAKQKQDAGVPEDVTLTEAGYDTETVEKWAADNASNLPARVALLDQVGNYFAAMATAVAAGAVTAEQADLVYKQIMGDLSGQADDSPPAAT